MADENGTYPRIQRTRRPDFRPACGRFGPKSANQRSKDLPRPLGPDYDPRRMAQFALVRALSATGLILVTGCGASNAANQRRLDAMDTRTRQIQAATDRLEERVAALEEALRAKSTEQVRTQSTDTSRPPLPVVTVLPNQDTSDPAPVETSTPNSDATRPLIVGEGTQIETRSTSDSAPPAASARGHAAPKSSSKHRGASASPKAPNRNEQSP